MASRQQEQQHNNRSLQQNNHGGGRGSGGSAARRGSAGRGGGVASTTTSSPSPRRARGGEKRSSAAAPPPPPPPPGTMQQQQQQYFTSSPQQHSYYHRQQPHQQQHQQQQQQQQQQLITPSSYVVSPPIPHEFRLVHASFAPNVMRFEPAARKLTLANAMASGSGRLQQQQHQQQHRRMAPEEEPPSRVVPKTFVPPRVAHIVSYAFRVDTDSVGAFETAWRQREKVAMHGGVRSGFLGYETFQRGSTWDMNTRHIVFLVRWYWESRQQYLLWNSFRASRLPGYLAPGVWQLSRPAGRRLFSSSLAVEASVVPPAMAPLGTTLSPSDRARAFAVGSAHRGEMLARESGVSLTTTSSGTDQIWPWWDRPVGAAAAAVAAESRAPAVDLNAIPLELVPITHSLD